MSKLTLVMPYYRNPAMLAVQYAYWQRWPQKIKDQIEAVIVDDGSPEPASLVYQPDGLPRVSIYRVLEDRPWHQHGARNLGAHVAPDGWLLMTDMDHVLEEESAFYLLKNIEKEKLDPLTCYMLDRIEATTRELTLGKFSAPKPHPNSFLVTRELYWRIGGYDEDFCGVYGTDRFFRERAFSRGRRGHLRIPLVRYWRGLVPDASTDAPRKEGREPQAKERILAEKKARGEKDVIKVLQFEWEQVL